MKYRQAMKIGKQLEGLFVRASKQVGNKLVSLRVSEDNDGQLVFDIRERTSKQRKRDGKSQK